MRPNDFPRRVAALLWLAIAPAPAAEMDSVATAVAPYFRPFQHEQAALSPDGRHVALTDFERGRAPAILIVRLEDRSSRSYPVDSREEHAVEQLRWVSATRLVFTTRGRAVAALELASGEIKPLLVGKDLDAYERDPELGFRHYSAPTTPDMPANSLVTNVGDAARSVRTMSVRDALAQGSLSGDLFDSRVRTGSSRALRPFLREPRPGAPHLVVIEVRDDADLLAYRRKSRTRLTVPGNTFLDDGRRIPPTTPEEVGLRPNLAGEAAAYDIDFAPPPLVVLELDPSSGRTRELAKEDDWRRVWLDGQGRLRLALRQEGARFQYLHRAPDARGWQPLDALVPASTPLGFAVAPATLLAPRSVPLGFDARGELLYFASNVGRNTFALRALHLAQGRLTDLEVAHEQFDLIEPTALAPEGILRCDPASGALCGVRFAGARGETVWFDAGLRALQAKLGQQLAPRRVDLREWTPDQARFLVEAAAPDDPGAFFVVDPAAGKLIRCADRAPGLAAEQRHPTRAFDFVTDDRRRLAGFLTRPRQPRITPPPVLVYFHDGPWYADAPVFNRGVQALAALGFAVLQINHRGSSGYGREHLSGIGDGLDRAVLADVRGVLARGRDGALGINTRLVAAFGNGIGGYLAVRMLQLAPETFRCAVAINAPGDLEAWRTHPEAAPSLLADLRAHVFGADRERLRAQSAVAAGPATKAPVLVVHGTANTYVPAGLGRELFRALQAGAEETAFLELPEAGHGGWSEATTARLFAELGRFFNATIYRYGVKVSPIEVVEPR